VPLVRSLLKIHHVEHYVLEDAAHIETQQLEDLTYEPAPARVTVTADVPVQLSAEVSRLQVSVEQTETSFGFRTVSLWFGGWMESARGVIESE
jgi:hypothetical protein